MRVSIILSCLLVAILVLHATHARGDTTELSPYSMAQASGDESGSDASGASTPGGGEEATSSPSKKAEKRSRKEARRSERTRKPKEDRGRPAREETGPTETAQPDPPPGEEPEEVPAPDEGDDVTPTAGEETPAPPDEGAESGAEGEEEAAPMPGDEAVEPMSDEEAPAEGGDAVAAGDEGGASPTDDQEEPDSEAEAAEGEPTTETAAAAEEPAGEPRAKKKKSKKYTAPVSHALTTQQAAIPTAITKPPASMMLVVPTFSSNFARKLGRQPRGFKNWSGFATSGRGIDPYRAARQHRTDLGVPDYSPSESPRKPNLTIGGVEENAHIFPGQPVPVSWDVASVRGATGVVILASTNPDVACNKSLDTTGTLPGSGYKPGAPQGSHLFDVGTIPLGTDVYFVGCAAKRSSPVKYLGESTNVLKAHYDRAPDLVISDLYIASGEFWFRVKNLGDVPKSAGEINYVLTITRTSKTGKAVNASFGGVAEATSKADLQPGQEAGDDKVSGFDLDLAGATAFTMCINLDGKVVESNMANNCLTRPNSDELPDLRVSAGHIELHPPAKGSSAPGADTVKFMVENTGGIPMAHFEIGVEVKENGRVVFKEVKNFSDPLAPGEKKEVAFPWVNRDAQDGSRYENPGIFTGAAMVDPNGTFLEVNESDNNLEIAAIRLK